MANDVFQRQRTRVSLRMSTIEKGNDVTDLTDDVGFLMSRASGILIQVTNAALADLGLRVRSYSVLVLACDTSGGMTQRDLAEMLGLDPSQVVQLVDDLERAGLVERRPSPADRRTRLIVATRSGRRVRAAAHAKVSEAQHDTLETLEPSERRALCELLTRVIGGSDADQASA